MTGNSVLIAAMSGRALAAAARRAGFEPLVVDAFGDEDTRAYAGALHCIESAISKGFRQQPVFAALDRLKREATRPVIGLVLGSGFEAAPKLVAELARRYSLLGNGADAITRANDPATIFPLLEQLGIPHPETGLDIPKNTDNWLCKRSGGSGGGHIAPFKSRTTAPRGRYFQRLIKGMAVSTLIVADNARVHIAGVSRQWCTETKPKPFRYGGAAGPFRPGRDIEARMFAATETVSLALGLVGIVSFDFILADGVPHLLDVNPRPSASMDIFDDAKGNLFFAHIAACTGENITLPATRKAGARASAILYADRSPLTVNAIKWPSWVADRPSPGTQIARAKPIATVFGDGPTAAKAELKCRQRLDELAHMLYGPARDRERMNAKICRTRSERISASGQTR